MDKPIENFWSLRLENLKETLESNNFEVYIADDSEAAKKIVIEEIMPKTGAKSMSWGGSMTLVQTGVYEALKACTGIDIIDTYEKGVAPADMIERRRRALLVDLFVTGTNAVSETGKLINLDMTGNRTAAITFGPKDVVILVGRNKIVPDIEDAMLRIKNYTAPTNAMRLDKKTPCAKTAFCEECHSPERICNTWTITEKAYPKGRIRVVLINQDLGL
ncbi:MAG: lactate utilization protein [Syntrophobacteraceae bacterium]